MATSHSTALSILAGMDLPVSGSSLQAQATSSALTNTPDSGQLGKVTDKAYDKLRRYWNVTSYSMLSELHACPRKFQLINARAAGGSPELQNVDFAFGHAVGAGVAAWASSNGDVDAALLAAILAWKIPFHAEIPKKNKSLWNALLAVRKYNEFYEEHLGDWKVWRLPNGKPAVELSIGVDFENGFKHYVHIDLILEHMVTGALAVQENKTSGFKSVEPALYANSSQALSYAALVDMLREDTSYEVFYLVFSTVDREWHFLPFTKNTALKAEWIMDVKLDHASISTYRELAFYPKRGESCFDFMRRCEFFGTCNLTANLPKPAELPADREAEVTDFSFTISEIIARQHQRNATDTLEMPAYEGASIENLD